MSRLANLKARLNLFATNATVLELRWQHVPNLGCRNTETARTITSGPSTWYNHFNRKGTDRKTDRQRKKYNFLPLTEVNKATAIVWQQHSMYVAHIQQQTILIKQLK